MKRIVFVLYVSLFLWGCGSNELTRKEAFNIIKEDLGYPRTVSFDLFCGDPAHAKKALDAGLEDKGLITLQRTVKLKDVGKDPIIQFTDKARLYRLETSEKDKSYKIQKVKVADEDITEVTGVQMSGDGKTATVEYGVSYKNVTDFAALLPKTDFTKPTTRRAEFALYDDGWRVRRRK